MSCNHWRRRCAALFVLAASFSASAEPTRTQPEAALVSSKEVSAVYDSTKGACVTANPYATQVCTLILKQSGSAVDAAVAAAFVLGLVEPQSSGIGGGGYALVHHESSTRAFDGRETAPASAKPGRFISDGEALAFEQAISSPLSVGVPGMVKLMHELHSTYGRLSWQELLEPAEQLARSGFVVSERLSSLIDSTPKLKTTDASSYFYPGAEPLKVGAVRTNPAYAQTLSQLEKDPDQLYSGDMADQLVQTLQAAGSDIILADLAGYEVKSAEAICRDYQTLNVCVPGLSTSGGITLLQTLGTLSDFESLSSAYAITQLTNAQALSFADRSRWLGDPAFGDLPIDILLSPAYLSARADLAAVNRALTTTEVVSGIGGEASEAAVDTPNTTHISVVDAQGQAISMTLSIEAAFGSKIWSEPLGFLLNNQLTDFNFDPSLNSVDKPNQVGPGKRPLSSMTPIIVLEQDQLKGVIGSPGGSRIIGFVTLALLRANSAMPVDQIVSQPHWLRRYENTEIEDTVGIEQIDQLRALGHQVITSQMASGLAVIWRSNNPAQTPARYDAAADPRREGVAACPTMNTHAQDQNP